ncbi:CpaD family pilus assembly protein [Aurantimonas sp. Leaf443]|uniref:CpaD family pilus assembly protein n=1 Tax=Aurantimonas sp. Leaf443 TaxID=1736378 RepID=UPI0006F37EE4|nr:CpaD family pilus assembly protein [Aurantimonas sp. Leaf443]KQT83058.1 pilus assembly protein CpaD [Aurantimonas sp. Leaf443]
MTKTSRALIDPLRPFAIALLLGLSGGCANVHTIEVGAVPDDYRNRHPIVVGEAVRTIEIPILVSDRALSPGDRSRVEDFGERFKVSGAGAIQVLMPAGAANDFAARHVTSEVVALLKRRRIDKARIYVQPYPAQGLAGPVPIRLAFATLEARTRQCGVWDADLGDTSENRNYTNFGCATQQNIAAQIADPRDLVSPRGMGEIDAQQRTNMLDKYRTGRRTQSDANDTETDYTW